MSNSIIKGLGFHHIGLKCADLARSETFYRALGLTEVVRWGEGEGAVVMYDLGDGGRIELFANGGDEYSANGKWIHFAMYVDDVDTAYETALSAGAQSLKPPKTVDLDSSPEKICIRVAFVKGPDGEELEFFKQV
ncbi:MAG: VOC family protein [Clostridia bacterium]|nr:VOC family protein [Clostridia bacterium]